METNSLSLEELRQVDVRTVDRDTLIDIKDVALLVCQHPNGEKQFLWGIQGQVSNEGPTFSQRACGKVCASVYNVNLDIPIGKIQQTQILL